MIFTILSGGLCSCSSPPQAWWAWSMASFLRSGRWLSSVSDWQVSWHFTRHCQLSLFILRRSHDGVRCLLHLSPVRVRDIPNSHQGPGEIPDNMQTLLGLLHTLHLTFALQSFIKSAIKLLYHDYQGVALTEIVGGIAIFTSPLVVYLVSKTLIPRRHENFPLSFKDIR